jgi:hypothetical protein
MLNTDLAVGVHALVLVLDQMPDFVHSWRRVCGLHWGTGRPSCRAMWTLWPCFL